MNNFTKANELTDLAISETNDREIITNYSLGKSSLRKTSSNDVEYITNIFNSFLDYYKKQIETLPESERQIEVMKFQLIQSEAQNLLKLFSFNKNILDKNLFMFYNIGYVNDIIRRINSGH